MRIIPAVDIRGGKCVQLVQGRPETAKDYGDPVRAARRWEDAGAETLHVVDLDAAMGKGNNLGLVKRIREEVSVPIQFGGGVRTLARARDVLNSGIDRVILGSAAVKDPEFAKGVAKEFGIERAMVAVDSLGGMVMIKGWTKKTGIPAVKLVRELNDSVFGFLVTDVDKEGLMKGVDVDEFKSLVQSTDARICASGGVASEEDIRALESVGVWGCVIGKALYEREITL